MMSSAKVLSVCSTVAWREIQTSPKKETEVTTTKSDWFEKQTHGPLSWKQIVRFRSIPFVFVQACTALSHSHISLHQSVNTVYCPSEATKQDDDQDYDDESRKPPAQQEVEQVSTLRVLIVHHQHLPEVHRLGTQIEEKN